MRPIRALLLLTLAATALTLAFPLSAAAQQRLDRPLRVYLDCNFHCDRDFMTQEIPWVDFVRDRQVADVHILGTREGTGAGGSVYTLEFGGLGAFEGERLTLQATTPPDVTDSDRRLELLRVLRLGLAPFAAATPRSPRVDVLPYEAAERGAAQTVQDDPWDGWVFVVGVNGNTDGESRQNSLRTNWNASGSRVTPDWKLRLSLNGFVRRQEYQVQEGETDTYTRESYSSEGQAVKSLGPHWAAGAIAEWRRSTYDNYDHSAGLGMGVEYNVFPYTESTRRLLTFFYAIGPRYNVYQDSTIFAETEELLVQQLFVASYDVIQPWGQIDVSANLDHYLAKFGDGDDWEDPQFNATLSGRLEMQLIRGLSARVHGRVSMVRGQIELTRGELTEEEILTQQRQLATNYRYSLGFGLSYRFGSIFSDVVNPRFQGI